MIVDRYGRPVRGLRISVNPSYTCNFKCVFCHMEGITAGGSDTMMTPEEIEKIVKILLRYNIKKVKLTGGEPMLRKDILEIVERLGRLGLDDLSMTTNGTRLISMAKKLRKAGLTRINISLHTVSSEKYCWITGMKNKKDGRTRYEYTIDAIKAAIEAGMNPVKLNVVVMKNVNHDEVDSLIEFASRFGGKVILQLIELIEEGISNKQFYERYHYDLREIEERFERTALKIITRTLHMRKQYLLPNGVWVEVVRPNYNFEFCMNDDRIRITHDGKFKPCLMRNDNLVDFLTPLRNGASEEELEKIFIEAIKLREPYYKPPTTKASEDISIIQEAL
ncbi:MAG: GTP 3',8-cyclase MoaA [Thaumarchaeota archaeon]|nr:GTP 3',8-cyclase MoaA [Candidatus Geocrenenecus arthurdayi]MCL7391510.1 GTP 3',8-cyclase MoaA [Candidatus Geocrenenecus arthurdayi]MCL7396940.1 GTP 3',8-cyclase MoaA [Candidatus Geocrenenecus arthurdayi]MCL7401252.1 GTP 3',8-cyclase MoaA [Candidatus Geocrenenecus arthurdayi]MCL7403871.1 GTP 3',8-cyclase MoaA [Candidatus Geocrenenecus arthurdayi]